MFRPLLAALALALGATACPAGAPDAGGPADAGDLDGGADDGGVEPDRPGDLSSGEACLIENDLCRPGLICARLFDEDPSAPARCWHACAVAGPCEGARGQSGECFTLSDGASICVLLSGNLGPCGDAIGSRCQDVQLCAFPPTSEVGHCVTPCSPFDPSTCANSVEGAACGCSQMLSDCSVEGIRLVNPDEPGTPEAADGVCIEPTLPGDACGLEPEKLIRLQCSPGQRCDAENATDGGLGACAAL